MRALVISEYGGPEALQVLDLPEATAGHGEVLIRTTAGGLNPVDALQRQGKFKALDPFRFPKVAGNELSGVVEFVGAGVTGFTPGDKVIARTGKTQLGAFADRVAVKADHVAPAPTSIPLVDAAGLPLAGLTAAQALGPEHLDVQPGERVLITGAAGGVGLLAVQLAALAGAEVTVTASSAGEELVRAAGAIHVIDYHAQQVSRAGTRFHKAFDLVGGATLDDLVGAMEPGGRVVSISGPPTPGGLAPFTIPSRRVVARIAEQVLSLRLRRAARKAGISYEFFLMHPDGQELARLARLVDEGKLTLTIDSRYAFDDFREAFARLESHRAKGKVVLEF